LALNKKERKKERKKEKKSKETYIRERGDAPCGFLAFFFLHSIFEFGSLSSPSIIIMPSVYVISSFHFLLERLTGPQP
jgi:hypothetical protein